MTSNTDWNALSNLYVKYGILTTGIHCQYAIDQLLQSYITPNTTVLDIGCGTGEFTCYIADKVKHVSAVDYSTDMVNILNNRITELQYNNVTTVQCSATDLSKLYGQTFDVIAYCFILMYDINIPDAINEALKLCGSNTILLFITWNGAEHMSWVHRLRQAKQRALQYTTDAIGSMAYSIDAPHAGCSSKHDTDIANILLEHNIKSTVTAVTLKHTIPSNLDKFYDVWYSDELSKPNATDIKRCWIEDMHNDMEKQQCEPYFEGTALYRVAHVIQ